METAKGSWTVEDVYAALGRLRDAWNVLKTDEQGAYRPEAHACFELGDFTMLHRLIDRSPESSVRIVSVDDLMFLRSTPPAYLPDRKAFLAKIDEVIG